MNLTLSPAFVCVSDSLSGSIADAINIAEVGAFDREEWKGISEKEVTFFEKSTFLRQKTL